MRSYPGIDELEVLVRAGRGVAVIVEGESYEDDPWFMSEWFGNRAREVAFFPQDGWPKVREAVAELRRRCSGVPVYGIIDRDFCDDSQLSVDFDSEGILRTPRYTLENYLLEAECWAGVFRFIFRRQRGAPEGWDDPVTVDGYIVAAYCDCLALSAHNWVIKCGNERYPQQAARTKESERSYRENPAALQGIDPASKLRDWGQSLSATEDLGALFEQRLQSLSQADLDTWRTQVSGKYVLSELHRRFPLPLKAGQFGLGHYLNEYMRQCSDAPADLAGYIDLICLAAPR